MAPNKNDIILQIESLNFAYSKNEALTLQNINFSAHAGKIYSILGQNGSGKTTLLHTISSIIKNYEGQILVKYNSEMKEIRTLKSQERAKIISLVSQQNNQNSLNVYDSVMLGRKPYINIAPVMVDYEMTSRAIDIFRLNHLSLKPTSQLSGGELQSVNIARAYAQNTKIMLLDEPTNNLDVKKQQEMFNILKDTVKNKNICIICVLHDINQAIKYADELIFMKDGKIIEFGDKSIVSEKLLQQIYGVEAKILEQGYIII